MRTGQDGTLSSKDDKESEAYRCANKRDRERNHEGTHPETDNTSYDYTILHSTPLATHT